MPVDKVDLVVNTDVLEHIPEDELPETVQRIASLSQNVFFHLHHAKAVAILPNGKNAHCTVWTPQQYANLFTKYFRMLYFLPGKNPVNTVCTTFNIPNEIVNIWNFLLNLKVDNYIDDLPNFMNLLNGCKENIIFPLQGWQGTNLVLDYLKYFNHIDRISCLAVESLQDYYSEKFNSGCPILPIRFMPHFRESAAIYVLFPREYHSKVKVFLQNFGFKNIIFINNKLISQCQSELQKFQVSGGITNWFMNDVTNKLYELKLKISEQQEICTANTLAFEDYRRRFRGKKIVIFGTGPTARYYKPMKDAIHIALNFAWRREDISFDYLFTADVTIKEKMKVGFEKIRDKIFIARRPFGDGAYHFNNGEDIFSNFNNVRYYYCECSLPNSSSVKMPVPQNICTHPLFRFPTIASAALNFALFTYPKEIYLVGCDTASNGYFYNEGNTYIGNAIDKIKVGYARMKIFANHYYPDTKIISVNPVGLKGLFEDVYTEDYLNTLKE